MGVTAAFCTTTQKGTGKAAWVFSFFEVKGRKTARSIAQSQVSPSSGWMLLWRNCGGEQSWRASSRTQGAFAVEKTRLAGQETHFLPDCGCLKGNRGGKQSPATFGWGAPQKPSSHYKPKRQKKVLNPARPFSTVCYVTRQNWTGCNLPLPHPKCQVSGYFTRCTCRNSLGSAAFLPSSQSQPLLCSSSQSPAKKANVTSFPLPHPRAPTRKL